MLSLYKSRVAKHWLGFRPAPVDNYGERQNSLDSELEKDVWLKIKPNPANNYFIVEYSLPEYSKEAVVVVYSIDGNNRKTISVSKTRDEFVVNTSGLKPGIYVVSLKADNTTIQSVKLSIVH